MYLARIIISKWGAGRDVISGLIFINTLGKHSCLEKVRKHTDLAALSGGIKATVGVGGAAHTNPYPAKTLFFQGCCVPPSTLTHALHCCLLWGRGVLGSKIAFLFLSLMSLAVIWPCINLDNIRENLSS